MDIYQFINSRDIREYLKKQEYQFSPVESAWLVWQCRSISMAQKHDAWREMIRTMPDAKIEERPWTREWPSLHEYLEKRIDYENRLFEAFRTKMPDAVYTVSVQLNNRKDVDYYDYLFSCFETCQEFVKNVYLSDEHDSINVIEIGIRKRYFDDSTQYMDATFNANWELKSIEQSGNVIEDICSEDDFAGMWFSFPTPFVKGDIVIDSDRASLEYEDNAFVLNEILPCEQDFIERHKKDADSSDMIATGYFQEECGSIYYECMHSYMNLEYYRDELTGKRRILKALSSFMKEEIDIALYSDAYRVILLEEFTKKIFPRYYTDEGLRLAGLK